MALADDLKNKVNAYFTTEFKIDSTSFVPGTDYSKLTFGNTALSAELTFLFVDIRKSSELHQKYGFINALRIYESFHDICLRIISSREGNVRAFDGDRIMGVFAGNRKNNNAVEAALNIRWAISDLLNSKLGNAPLSIGIGIDTGTTLITKVGQGRNIDHSDLVWVGKACNYASHLSSHGNNSIIISEAVFGKLEDSNKVSKDKNIWMPIKITLKSNKVINAYSSTYHWSTLKG